MRAPTSCDVVFITTHLGRGGAEKQIALLAKALISRGWTVGVFSLQPASAHRDELRIDGAEVFEADLRKSPLSLLTTLGRLVRMLRMRRPRVVVTFNHHANVLGRIAARLARVPRVVSSIRSPFLGGRHRDLMERLTSTLDDVTTTNSRLVALELRRRNVVPRVRPLVVVQNIVPPVTDLAGAPSRVAKDNFVWLAVGRLEPPKGYPVLIEAFSHLPRHTELVIAGAGRMGRELQSMVQARGNPNIRFIGESRNVPQLLASCDGFVMPSLWEGMPNALMEAMQAGLPVVATEVGGVPELIENEVSGLIVPPHSAHELSAAMRRVQAMTDAERRAMGARAKAAIEERHAEGPIVDRWIALLEGRDVVTHD